MAVSNQLNARAALDPILFASGKRKSFGGIHYYNYQQIGLEVPTKSGLNVLAGFENNEGPRLANEVSTGRSIYSGLSLNVQDVVYMNKRQLALAEADLFTENQKQRRSLQMNTLIAQAQLRYYNWLQQYLIYKVFDELTALNTVRLELVKTSWSLGKVPAVDTIDVLSQLNRFRISKNKAFVNWREEGIKLSDYIWDETLLQEIRGLEVLPDTSLLGANAQFDVDTSQLQFLIDSHPAIASLNIKEELVDLKGNQIRQSMMPNLSVNALVLSGNKGEALYENVPGNMSFGLALDLPLRFSAGRSMRMQNNIEKLDVDLKRDVTRRKMNNQLLYRWNELQIARQNIKLYEEFVLNSRDLLAAEEVRYNLGSGTVFKINIRENRLLDARLKQIENYFSYQKNLVSLFGELNALERLGKGPITIEKINELEETVYD